ncbi:GNAT family N-acetyltransferase [Kitasatospora sp. NPDC088346]|uniref:GNAT family N-acetyltransferase n=1 Tax=Kitasatospora sp. NPDC088346 TaxID=3364073 RepID=UPI0037F8B860
MEIRRRLELANDNAAAFLLARAEANGWEQIRRPDFTAARCVGRAGEAGGTGARAEADRVVVTRPYADPAALRAQLVAQFREGPDAEVCVEDPYNRLDLSGVGFEAGIGMAVMAREPLLDGDRDGAVAAGGGNSGSAGSTGGSAGGDSGWVGGAGGTTAAGSRPGTETCEVLDADGLALVERTVVEGFPVPAYLPWRPGGLLPAALLQRSGFRAWLARRDGEPASACLTYDDGEAVGVYWVATMPEYRSQGAGRAVLEHALTAYPDRVVTLVATLLGEPLYRKLGFREHGVSRWWRYPAATPVPAPAPAPSAG